MSENLSRRTPDNRLIETIKSLVRKLENLKTNQLARLVVPNVASDPASPITGEIWFNTTSNVLKLRKNSTTVTITTS